MTGPCNATAKRYGDSFTAAWRAVCYRCGWRSRDTTRAGAETAAAAHNTTVTQ